MSTKRWSFGIKALIEETASLVAEIDGRLLSQKLLPIERSSLNSLKVDLKKKLATKKLAFKGETLDSLKIKVLNLEKQIDDFPNALVTKERYKKSKRVDPIDLPSNNN